MTRKTNLIGAFALGASLIATTGAASASIARRLPLDVPTQVNGVRVACSGVGERDRASARWHHYAVRLEAVGGYGQFLGDETLTVKKPDGAVVARFSCSGPWAMMDLAPGKYSVAMALPNAPTRHVRFVLEHANKTVIVQFPKKMAGEPRRDRMAERS